MIKGTASLDAHKHLPGTMTSCSWRAGWRSVLLRGYHDAPEAEFTTPPTGDHLIVLVVGGKCNIEARNRSEWRKATYKRGSVGMTSPGQEVMLRWRGETSQDTLQLHIPEFIIRSVIDDFADRNVRLSEMPNALLYDDPFIGASILSLSRALPEGIPDLYAESAAHFLTAHLLVRHRGANPRPTPTREDLRLRRVDEFLRANLSAAISLDDIANVAGVSRFHLVRLFKQSHNETPFRRLTRMRMDEAARRLVNSRETVTAIGFACGYENPAHFASAFSRLFGMSPRQYRQNCA